MNKVNICIRVILFAALVYFVYQETGFFTALSMTFIFVYTELSTMCHTNVLGILKVIEKSWGTK
jgi:hypothetical protein